ncbi:WbqC family protein [Tenacibaculum larymnensis]|uniref:WbqC family protein n=1 Tax=Tenacibaculum larymnensis TaxID=2878201 RepID=A0A9X4EPW0_9FLAO|nr:WbqC family protein [Tenacibaculum larymnensis]MDE1208099.1 WbqC family protein [Tenacibaculum larymnensis]
MKVAIMQPYIFPYLGYFQLIKSVDVFVFYDDVNFIKRGWVNRNKILVNNKEKLISFPCIAASQNKLINEVTVDLNDKQYVKLLQTIKQAYVKAPYYSQVYPVIEEVFFSSATTIAELAIISIKAITAYLNLDTIFYNSSASFSSSKGVDKADRLITITKQLGADTYINAIGGTEIYTKDYFKENKVSLYFLEPELFNYKQFNEECIKGLSIIDILMFNDKEQVNEMLKNYDLV